MMSEKMTEGADVEETAATPEANDAPAAEPATWLEGIEDDKVKNLAGRYTTPAAMANALYEANRELSQRVKMPVTKTVRSSTSKWAFRNPSMTTRSLHWKV